MIDKTIPKREVKNKKGRSFKNILARKPE